MKIRLPSLRGVFHPVAVFVYLQIVWVAVVFLWVIGFFSQKATLSEAASKFGEQQAVDSSYGLIFLIVGCLLLALILFGTIFLFIISIKQSSFLKQQRDFVSSITHELRSPLASLQLSFETMQQSAIPEKVYQRLVTMIQADINRLASHVDRILVAARLQQRIYNTNQSAEPIQLKALTEDIANNARHLDEHLIDRLQIDCPEELVINLPRDMLTLIIGNLVENATKFSPSGSNIKVSGRYKNGEFIIRVKDFGIGLTKKDKKKIFKMFYRSNQAYENAVNGTGVGLFIVKSTLKALKGHIKVESEGLNQGTEFIITIPQNLPSH